MDTATKADCAGLPYHDDLHDYGQVSPIDYGKDDGRVFTLKHREQCTKCGCKREVGTVHHREDESDKEAVDEHKRTISGD